MLHSGQRDCSLFDYFMVGEKVKCWCKRPNISNGDGGICQQRRGWQVGQLHPFTGRVWILTVRGTVLFQLMLPKANNLKEAKDSWWEIRWRGLREDLPGSLIPAQTQRMIPAEWQPYSHGHWAFYFLVLCEPWTSWLGRILRMTSMLQSTGKKASFKRLAIHFLEK